MAELLRQIQTAAQQIEDANPDIQKLIKQLLESTAETISRVESVK
jgi:methyl-accepting chemotaxis protein